MLSSFLASGIPMVRGFFKCTFCSNNTYFLLTDKSLYSQRVTKQWKVHEDLNIFIHHNKLQGSTSNICSKHTFTHLVCDVFEKPQMTLVYCMKPKYFEPVSNLIVKWKTLAKSMKIALHGCIISRYKNFFVYFLCL